MEATQDGTVQTQGCDAAWTRTDELNWAADRATIRVIKKRGEAPSEWLATEYRELSARRRARATGCAK